VRVDDGLELQPPTDAASIAAAELQLGVTLQPKLRSHYEATNGVYDKPGEWFVLWRTV
jgi:cell wall assembly regulator SMI1